MKADINTAAQWLGADNARELRNATAQMQSQFQAAQQSLQVVKELIGIKLAGDKALRDETLNTLGFTTIFKDVQRQDQEALIQMLARYEQNLTDSLSS